MKHKVASRSLNIGLFVKFRHICAVRKGSGLFVVSLWRQSAPTQTKEKGWWG